MKSVCFVFLSLALTASAQTLRNPSFETAGESADRAAGWERWGDWINREEGWKPVHTGDCLIGYHHWEIPDAKDSGIYQDITGAKAGTRYEFGVWVNRDKHSDEAARIEVRLEATVDGQQQTLGSQVVEVTKLPPNAWHKLKVTGQSPNDTLRALIIVTPKPEQPRGGALRIDDAYLNRAD